MSPVLASKRNASISILGSILISALIVLGVTQLSSASHLEGQECPAGQAIGYHGCNRPPNQPGVTVNEVTPNGNYVPNELNAVTLTGGGSGADITNAIQQ